MTPKQIENHTIFTLYTINKYLQNCTRMTKVIYNEIYKIIYKNKYLQNYTKTKVIYNEIKLEHLAEPQDKC